MINILFDTFWGPLIAWIILFNLSATAGLDGVPLWGFSVIMSIVFYAYGKLNTAEKLIHVGKLTALASGFILLIEAGNSLL